ncbi:ABC transporter permease [Bacillus paranthracis]|uniref:ABC transporter permease n=1 Tax=Bacillus paranthracis TaxID=2026186 RepID=UPI000200EF82|nr:ABC transporter permease [Bacillus paranthracis]ADY20208.1 oligopeptide ABC transporter, permease protein [Bacillus thuringiensis serovar finitimus YBT-020]MRC73761.1 ABC transporter permease subunit [Bacillus thuringiensis]OTX70907.1 peptide ABC transporter permease [Bacillus thuringiensis serovar finitimus]MCR6799508.1 ABC transporter permease [Bacillus paranthracis]MEC3358388.1 ABC transporter permease [Bacillus paranthracis]
MNNRRFQTIKSSFTKNKFVLMGVIILTVLTVASIFAFVSPYDPSKMSIPDRLQEPSVSHLFGTDDYGRDYLTRALYGGRVSLAVGFLAMVVSVTIGTAVGTISGYFGGKLDNFLMRVVEVLMSIPSFFLMLLLNAYLKPGITTLVLIIGLLTWMDTARIVRAETLSVKEREYVLYAKVSGQKSLTIIVRHIIPNILSTIIIAATLTIATSILMESSLSFLGLGIREPDSSWGSMLNNAQGYIGEAWYLTLFPGFLILLTVLSFNVIGEALKKAFAPKGAGNEN